MLYQELISAVIEGNIEQAESLLARRADINVPGYIYDSSLDVPHELTPSIARSAPLHFAAARGNTEMVKLLLQYRANVNLTNSAGWTPLTYAAQKDHIEVIKLLLHHDADVNMVREHLSGCKPIIFAAKVKNTEMVQLLLQHGADPSSNDCQRNTPLLYAAEAGNTEMVQLLLQHGADPNYNDCQSKTPLLYAAEAGNTEMVQLLLQHGADPSSSDCQSNTPLLYAAEAGNTEMVQLLLQHGADPNYDDCQSKTPLLYAAEAGNTEMVQLLLQHGADPSSNDCQRNTPLLYAAEAGNTEMVQLLLQHGADPSSSDCQRNTPLLYAAEAGNTEMVQLLLQHGADPNYNDCQRKTPLLYAAEAGNIKIVKLLLLCGADPNYNDCQGKTPLLYAFHAGNIKMAKLLLQYEADSRAIPIYCNSNREDVEMIGLLIRYGARVTPREYFSDYMNPIFNSLYKKNMKFVVLSLLNHPNDICPSNWLQHYYRWRYNSCPDYTALKEIMEMPNLNRLIEANKNKTNVISEYTNNKDQWNELIQELRIIKKSYASYMYEGLQIFIEHLITSHYEKKHNEDRSLIENNRVFLCYFLRKISNVDLVLDEIDQYLSNSDRNKVFLAYRQDIIDRSCSNQKVEVTMEFKQDMSKVDTLLTELKEVEPVSKFQSCTIL